MKQPPSKVAHNLPKPFFSVLPIGPNPAQISIPVPKKSPTAELLYNDFACNRDPPLSGVFIEKLDFFHY